VLTEQRANTASHVDDLTAMRDQAYELQRILRGSPSVPDIGAILDQGWRLKRRLASAVSNPQIDRWYNLAMAAGACGGKIAGAGNGGFLLLVVEPERQPAVRAALADLTVVSVLPEVHGSQVLLPLMS
jgi:D-glycero-alpha-D-manno-heptose-7-phosphate kinase